MTIIQYQTTNAGEYQIIEQTTDDQKLIAMWCNRSRKSESGNTASTYTRIAKSFMETIGKPFQAIMYPDLEDWLHGLTGSVNTRRLHVNAIRSLFTFAHQLGYIRINPAKMLTAPAKEEAKHRKMLSEEEIIKLVSGDLNLRDEAILRVLYSSGMRVSELTALTWQDVIALPDRKAELVIRGKGGKTRQAGISASAYHAMLAIKPGLAPGDSYIFLSNRKSQMDRTTINWLFAKLSTKLGKHISPHWMRHSHASHALARGASPVDVQEQLGHSSLETTTGYGHKQKNSSDSLII